MAAEYKLSFTAEEIDQKLKEVKTTDQTYNPESKNAQSGVAVEEALESLDNSFTELWKPWTAEYWTFREQPDTAYNAETNVFTANVSSSGSILATLNERIDVSHIKKLYIHIESNMPEGAKVRPIISCYNENGEVMTTTVSGWSYLAYYGGHFCNFDPNSYKQFVIPKGTKSISFKFSTTDNGGTVVGGTAYNFRISVRKEEVVTKYYCQVVNGKY